MYLLSSSALVQILIRIKSCQNNGKFVLYIDGQSLTKQVWAHTPIDIALANTRLPISPCLSTYGPRHIYRLFAGNQSKYRTYMSAVLL